MVACDMNVPPEPLHAIGIYEARRSVRRHQQVHRFAAILRYQCSIRSNSGTGGDTRVRSTSCALIEIVRGAKRMKVSRVDFHGSFSDLYLKTGGVRLPREVGV